MLDDVELRELRILLAVLVAAMRETGAQRPGAGVRAGCPLPWPASPPAAGAWPPGRTRPSAARTVNVETPVAAAICRSVCPAASSPAIRAASAGVSFDAPFGPRRTGTSPATPPQASAWSPPPDGGRVHPERLRHLALRRGPQPHQLHRGQPAARLVPGIPGEGGQPVHRDQPAVLAGQQAHARGDLGRPGRQQRERKLAEHTSHHPARLIILQEFSHKSGAKGGNDTP
jgi:hypothetical protein